jgi:hypothetical protein
MPFLVNVAFASRILKEDRIEEDSHKENAECKERYFNLIWK